ncbi:MAG: hypothetical protein U0T75_02570 [Chitinophagales bacterium]
MTSIELKKEIQTVLDSLPEDSLTEVLAFLRLVEEQGSNKIVMADNVRRILLEDKELLEKLAK